MKKKIGIIVGVVVGILVVAAATFAIIKLKNNTPSPSPTPDTNGEIVKDEETIRKEQQEKLNNAFEKAKYEVNAELEKVLVGYTKSELKETDPWQETLKYHPEGINTSISLKDFKDKGYDVSMFHTEIVECDEVKTYGNLNVTVGKTEYSANLYCTYSFKSNENFEIIK